jgi:subtilisin family serine protease
MRFLTGLTLSLALVAPSLSAGQIGQPIRDPRQERPRRAEIAVKQQASVDRAVDLPVDLIVEFRGNASVTRLRGDLSALQQQRRRMTTDAVNTEEPRVGRTFSLLLNGAGVHVPRELVPAISALPYVAKVHLARKFSPMGFGEGAVSARLPVRATPVRATASARGAGVTVAIIDTGIDYNHPALGGGIGPGHKVIGGYDFASGDDDPMDTIGHGTHVAGIVAGDGAGVLGVAPDVSLLAYKVFSGISASEEDIIAAIERSVDPNQDGDPADHADVVNMSLGGMPTDDDPVIRAVQSAVAAGVVFCIAAGNTWQYGYINSPAAAEAAISVGAFDAAQNAVAPFSTRGPSFSYGIKPEIAAPGVEILSTVPGGGLATSSGTSMASPYVAGVASLVKSAHPQWSPAEIKAAIIASSRTVADEVMAAGGGIADPAAAASLPILIEPPTVGFGQNDGKQSLWTSSRTVALRNLTNAGQTLTASVTGLREGVTVSVTPAQVTLAPGETRNVEIALRVTNALVPAPMQGSLSFGGQVEWSGGATRVHAPWAFVKGAYFTIDESSGGVVSAWVAGSGDLYWTGDFIGRTRVFWPLEAVDVVLMREGFPMLVSVAEEIATADAPSVSINVDAADLSIPLETTDETGRSLAARDIECKEILTLVFPTGKKLGLHASSLTRPRLTRISPRIKIYPMHTCGDPETTTVYAALHAPLSGLESTTTSTLHPQWLRQDIQFTPELPRDEATVIAFTQMRFPGNDSTYYWSGGDAFIMRGVESKLKVFFTPSPAPEVDFMADLSWWGRCYDASYGHKIDCGFIDDSILYFNEQTVAADTDSFLEISPMAYRLPLGETMTLGRAPAVPQVKFAAGSSWWQTQAYWFGSLGELRVQDTIDSRIALYDAGGTRIGEGPIYLFEETPLPPGRYRIEATNSQVVIGNARAKATYNAWVDTTLHDSQLPLLMGLRIVDEDGRQTDAVARDSHPALLFSVADVITGKVVGAERVPPREEATRVDYRVHGTSEWHPLPALIQERHYPFSVHLNGGTGTMYRIDLAAATNPIGGSLDLRIYFEDMAGNNAELVLEPAVQLGLTTRRRSTR